MSKGKRQSYDWIDIKGPEKYPQDMNLEANRVKSFDIWPFRENCLCTPAKMAEAGFYHCPNDQEPDLVRCYVCLKELDGWNPHDDPWEEHRSHGKQCPFAQLGKPMNQMTVKEFLKMEADRHTIEIKKYAAHLEEQTNRLDSLALEKLKKKLR